MESALPTNLIAKCRGNNYDINLIFHWYKRCYYTCLKGCFGGKNGITITLYILLYQSRNFDNMLFLGRGFFIAFIINNKTSKYSSRSIRVTFFLQVIIHFFTKFCFAVNLFLTDCIYLYEDIYITM